MSWRAEDLATGTALQLGSTTAELDGVVVAQGVEIPRDPARIRFSIFPTCVADVDDGSGAGFPDGGVTIDDLLYFLTVFESGDLAADVDDGSSTGTPDGGVTIDDLLYYLFRFEAGC